MANIDDIIDKIAKDIEEDHGQKITIDFVKAMDGLLKRNGVIASFEISKQCGIAFDSLDFTEHDKGFKDEINRLKENIKERDSYIKQLKHDADELKENNSTVELPFDAIEVANFLINEKYECNIPFVGGKTKCRKYEIEDLEQIAEHLLVYCKHNNIEEE